MCMRKAGKAPGESAVQRHKPDPLLTVVYSEFVTVLLRPIFALPAGVVELVDTPDLGSGAARCGGSSPSARTKV